MANSVLTEGLDLDYIQKDWASTLDALITYAEVNYGPGTSPNKLWTNFNTSSFSRTWAELLAYVADTLYYYLDQQATQSYLQTATIQSAVLDIATQFGFTPSSATSASGLATFTVTGPTTINRGFQVSSTNGSTFYVTNNTVISLGPFPTTITTNVLQGVIDTDNFNAIGLQNEEFDLSGPNVIVDSTNLNAADLSPIVTVSGNTYVLVSSFIQFNATDVTPIIDSLGDITTMGGRVFTLGTRPNGTQFIRFGDGIFGRKLNPGEVVSAIYRTGGGTVGNIDAGTLTSLVSANSLVTGVTNVNEFSGGTDPQTIQQLAQLIPASLRTIERAVAQSDYSDLILANFPQVLLSSTDINTTQAGIDLNIYVVPQGSGIPQLSDNPSLKNSIFTFVDKRKTVTVQFQLLDAFASDVIIALTAYLTDTASQSAVTASLQTVLQSYFSTLTGGPNGAGVGFATPILFKDVINLIETVQGIDRFDIQELSYHPRIVETVVGSNTTYTNQSVMIYPSVGEYEWLIASDGAQSTTSGVTLYNNTISGLTYTYTSGTGLLQYNLPVGTNFIDLSPVGPNDTFIDSGSNPHTIHAVDYAHYSLILNTGESVTAATSTHSIQSAANTYQSFACFKKILSTISSFSFNTGTTMGTLTDSNMNLTKYTGIGTAIAANILLDNSKTFVYNELAGITYIIIDSSGNTWNILSNDNNSIRVGTSALNNALITSISSGAYTVVYSLQGSQILLNGNIYPISQPYNTSNTVYSLGSNFPNVSNIGNSFQISTKQSNLGAIGMAVDIFSFSSGVATITQPAGTNYFDLQGVNGTYVLIDNTGAVFKVSKVDDSTATKKITVDYSSAPTLGVGASLVPRYYDDHDEVSLIIGITSNISTVPDTANTANAYGKATVLSVANSNVDNFVFRTSAYSDDITNFRNDEIPQLQLSDITINLVGGVN